MTKLNLFIVNLLIALQSVYLFCYFKGNGEDGLHLAYSCDGLKWEALNNDKSVLTPTAGSDKLMRDPCILKGPDGYFHMVWTVSWKEKEIGYARSKDLINWSEQKAIPVMAHEQGAQNCWAPEINYDKEKKEYLIYWATTIEGRFPETLGAGDGKNNHRMYCTTTKDFEIFTPTRLFYEPGFNCIDASINKVKGEFVIWIKNETLTPPEKNIRIATSAKLQGPYSAASAPVTGNYWAEGPTALLIGDLWHLYFDKYRDHQYGLLVSPDLKNWEDWSVKLIVPEGLRHGTVFKVTKREFKKLEKKLSTK
jgi:hypothetical protein